MELICDLCQELRFQLFAEVLMPTQGPIRHVVILFKENHGYDNYFGTFSRRKRCHYVAFAKSANARSQPYSQGWLNRGTGAVRQQFLESDIPTYFAYARQFTLCDNYFTDVAGPSTPNHLMLLTAGSPVIDNPSGNPVYDLPSLPSSLEAAGLTWGNYGGYAFGMIKALAGRSQLASDQFAKDAAAEENFPPFPGCMHLTLSASIRPTRRIKVQIQLSEMSPTVCSGRSAR